MKFLLDKNPTVLTISEFYDNFLAKKYNFDVGYQREGNVWNDDAKSFLIDTIMKNYPMPPIVLNPKLEKKTGRTLYDVVDGKQRLTTIIQFIENKIPLTSYFSNDEIFDKDSESLAKQIENKTFNELQTKDGKFDIFIEQFWTYKLSIDMVYEDNYDLVSTIFDRLNRNGAPLNNQELRHANYGDTELYKLLERLTKNEFWNGKLKNNNRMQNVEFISELFFTSIKGKVITTTNKELDNLYKDYSLEKDFKSIEKTYKSTMDILTSFPIDYKKYKRVCSTTHLFSLFSLAQYIHNTGITIDFNKINNFYNEYFYQYDENKTYLYNYYTASSNGTHSMKCRQIRLDSLLEYCKQ